MRSKPYVYVNESAYTRSRMRQVMEYSVDMMEIICAEPFKENDGLEKLLHQFSICSPTLFND